jgi:hypothetical protein
VCCSNEAAGNRLAHAFFRLVRRKNEVVLFSVSCAHFFPFDVKNKNLPLNDFFSRWPTGEKKPRDGNALARPFPVDQPEKNIFSNSLFSYEPLKNITVTYNGF